MLTKHYHVTLFCLLYNKWASSHIMDINSAWFQKPVQTPDLCFVAYNNPIGILAFNSCLGLVTQLIRLMKEWSSLFVWVVEEPGSLWSSLLSA